ncbi:LLM class flavin-dependent oxidoreductase [Xylanimonas allomyrinae]|uniref:LLM class flavin-dependent oxidoreductase n=1 Tax=Xylanimonas allomyrinae TaxID=2509459 RepID=A0A4P6EKI2_9MICO|nr:LLM class flavin-dependent oxidoreductase [Xylanimonas allomyrinae]QAY63132.1 LLM class flavin-dependent oxidoreductase [Xylanimonas allomyrinae]
MMIGLVGSYGSPAQMVRLAHEAEQHGWDGFFTWDGVSLADEGFDTVACYDPFSILAAVASVTQRITLGALVFAAPRHRPWELAQRALTVDHLSGGRLVLPVGVGVPTERAVTSVHGQPSARRDRAGLLDDVLAWLERSWSGEEFSFEGTHLSTGPFRFPQRPVHGRIPVWPVAVWDADRPPLKSLDRALRWDGVVAQVRGDSPEDAEAGPEAIAGLVAWAAAHRDPAAGPWQVVVQGRLSADDGQAAEQLAAAADAGATWWVESWWDPRTVTPEHLLRVARRRLPRP